MLRITSTVKEYIMIYLRRVGIFLIPVGIFLIVAFFLSLFSSSSVGGSKGLVWCLVGGLLWGFMAGLGRSHGQGSLVGFGVGIGYGFIQGLGFTFAQGNTMSFVPRLGYGLALALSGIFVCGITGFFAGCVYEIAAEVLVECFNTGRQKGEIWRLQAVSDAMNKVAGRLRRRQGPKSVYLILGLVLGLVWDVGVWLIWGLGSGPLLTLQGFGGGLSVSTGLFLGNFLGGWIRPK
jgi:hypothetical protein